MNNMEDLVILNYNTSEVHFYKIGYDTGADEDFIRTLGHNPNECSWMFGENINIVKHEQILK